jgi:hypothetical protein
VCGHEVVGFIPRERKSFVDYDQGAGLVNDEGETKEKRQFFSAGEAEEPGSSFFPEFFPTDMSPHLEKFQNENGGDGQNKKATQARFKVFLGQKMEEAERREQKKTYRSEEIKIFCLSTLELDSQDSGVKKDSELPDEKKPEDRCHPDEDKNRYRRRIAVIFQCKRRDLDIQSDEESDAEAQESKKKDER